MADKRIKDWFIIMNPVAGGGKATKYWSEMEQLFLSNGFDFEMVQTTSKGDAIELARKAVLAGYKKIIAIGGDGTNNEVVNGIFSQTEIPTRNIVYTLIPVGTGNDWVKTYGISKDFRQWIPLIKQLKTRKQDLGLVSYYSDGEKKESTMLKFVLAIIHLIVGKACSCSPCEEALINIVLFSLFDTMFFNMDLISM